MKPHQKLLPFLITGLLACNNNKADDASEKTPLSADTSHITVLDTAQSKVAVPIPAFIVDDYPVTNEMFGKGTDAREIKIGDIRSLDKNWFFNDSLQQVLVFELYTDYHRLVTYHFLKHDVPAEIIKNMEFTLDNGEPATFKQKQAGFMSFIAKSQKINAGYFTSNKGFALDDSKEKILGVYGKPDKTGMADGVERYEWDYTGDLLYDGKSDLKGKLLAKNSYGHHAILFFRNNKLIGQILHNDIP